MRNRLIRVAVASVAFVALAAGAASAQGQPWDKRTHFTFSGPVAVPGVTLPAGKYLFRLVDTHSHNVIQVLSANGQTSYAMFFGLRAIRSDVPSQPEVRFMETAAGVPAAIDSWWYPGQRTGYEFVYPKEQARLLAEGTGHPVLTTVEEAPAETGGEFTRTAPGGEEYTGEVPEAVGPIARGEVAPPSLEVAEPAQELPKTATAMPMVGLGALALLLGAAFIRVWRFTLN